MKRYLLISAMALIFAASQAQDDHVKFTALSRTLQQNNVLSEEDTINNDRSSTGHTLMDLGVNINPDRKTEIQSLLRFKTDLGGFFGEGTEVELRQIRVAGVVKDAVHYEVGDIYLQMSPFTLFNSAGEGSVNEATVFSDLRRDVAHYENFNMGNYWWQQGAHVDFGLAFEETATQLYVDAFFLRNRGTDFVDLASSFMAGGRVKVQPAQKTHFTMNYINLYDDGATVNADSSTRNPVISLEAEHSMKFGRFDVTGAAEFGLARLVFEDVEDSLSNALLPDDYEDIFIDAGISAKDAKTGLSAQLGYRYVGPEFFSAGAQSKRVNFNQSPDVFSSVNNNPSVARAATIFDLTRDDQLYSPIISRQLMAYDPRLSNVMPYGVATPNRQGITWGVAYTSPEKIGEAKLTGGAFSDVIGEGSTEKRQFMLVRLGGVLDLAKLLDWKKKFELKGGLQWESTTRDDSLGVDLKSTLVDAGLDLEVVKNFEVLAGIKMLNSEGNEFLYTRNEFNELGTPTAFDVNQSEMLMALGLKYNFNERIYLTAQTHSFQFTDNHEDASDEADYGFNQVVLLFNMKL